MQKKSVKKGGMENFQQGGDTQKGGDEQEGGGGMDPHLPTVIIHSLLYIKRLVKVHFWLKIQFFMSDIATNDVKRYI